MPKMALGDLNLPYQEYIEYIRRLRQGEGTEADVAMRAQQLTDKAQRLARCPRSTRPCGRTERGWARGEP
jgi:hypothetical protein